MSYGILERDIEYIRKALETFPEVEQAILFGSRAMGNYKRGSDVDIVLKGNKINQHICNKISYLLNEEYPVPYFVEVISYNQISNEELRNHIAHYGKVIYNKSE